MLYRTSDNQLHIHVFRSNLQTDELKISQIRYLVGYHQLDMTSIKGGYYKNCWVEWGVTDSINTKKAGIGFTE